LFDFIELHMELIASYFASYGRIARGTLFYRLVAVAVVCTAFGTLADALFGSYGSALFALLALWCFGALFAQRLHDTGRSAWSLLVVLIPVLGPIWLLIRLCKHGAEGVNRFGDDPTARAGYLMVDISR
jgi:uncharacterized membrane protein YhaH (DUF805 family)